MNAGIAALLRKRGEQPLPIPMDPYPWNAGINPCDGQTKRRIPALPPRPRGNQPSIVLALIERAPHGNTGINQMGAHSST